MLICMKTAHCKKLDGHSGACGKTAVTAPDVRTAAQAEAERRFQSASMARQFRETDFVEGAAWGAALVTPTREQIAEALQRDTRLCYPDGAPVNWEKCADAVLALMQG